MPKERAAGKAEMSKASRRVKDIKAGKAYRLTCSNCRNRKVKCDGQQPECRICLAYGEKCHYDKPPPMSQVLAMQARIDDLERKLAAAEKLSSEPESIDFHPRAPVHSKPLVVRRSPTQGSVQSPPSLARSGCTRLAQHESPSYYPSTSAIQPPVHEDLDADVVEPPSGAICPWSQDQLAFWEDAAAQAGAVQLSLPKSTVAHLLRTNATWIHSAFLFTLRPYFLRDSATGSEEYSSPLLMATTCLHATRFTHRHLQPDLSSRVQLLLGQTLHRDPSIPTVQSLLYLSARETGSGAWSQGWLYAGMAFRMAVDLGVFAGTCSRDTDPVRKGISDQLAWACFSWDKAVSLYLGRTPSLPEAPNFEPYILDESGESGTWCPYFEDQSTEGAAPGLQTQVLSHPGSCFVSLCRLNVIVNDILLTIYVNKSVEPLPFVQQTKLRLDEWRATSPRHVLIESDCQQCPPPHILTLNALYYAATILLHRPFRSSPGCLVICRGAAEAVERLVVLLENSYGLSYVTYLMAYSVYTAATVAVLDMQDNVEGSQRAVKTYLRAFYGIQKGCPGIQRSIDIILKALETDAMSGALSAPNPQDTSRTAYQVESLPAFPLDTAMLDLSSMPLDDFSSVPFGDLDPFVTEWSRYPMEAFEEYMALGNEQQAIF